MTAVSGSRTGNCSRFAARPLTVGGTATQAWRGVLAETPEFDFSGCREIVVVAAHPDDETFGFGATANMLANAGVRVQVVVVSDGGASWPGLTHRQSRSLARMRHIELGNAIDVLGLQTPIWLGLPDGELADHEGELTDRLGEVLARRPGAWCAANWRGDGHPDHEAVGRVAAIAAADRGAILLEYPLWMWHWATPDDLAVPWNRTYVTPTGDEAVKRKSDAARCYRSQLEAPRSGADPVLPPFVVERLLAIREVVFH